MEVHDDPWWIQKYEAYGFRYSQTLSDQVRHWAGREMEIGPDGSTTSAEAAAEGEEEGDKTATNGFLAAWEKLAMGTTWFEYFR